MTTLPASRSRSRHARRRYTRVLRTFSAVGLAFVLVAWALERFVAERHGLAAALTYIPQQPLAVPGLLLLALSLTRRDLGSVILNLAAVFLAGVLLLDFRFSVPRASRERATLRVLTWNIHLGSGGLDRIAATIRAANPDIICLQEAVAARGRFTDAEMRRMLPGYTFARSGDVLAASRLPIVGSRVRRFHDAELWRTAQQLDVRTNGRTVHILSVHFLTGRGRVRPKDGGLWSAKHWRDSASLRMEQSREVTGWIGEMQGPVIVAGDFNTPPRGLAFRRLATHTSDAFDRAGRGFGYTYPAACPLLRIDHIFVGQGAEPVTARVLFSSASDHRPVMAEIHLSSSVPPR